MCHGIGASVAPGYGIKYEIHLNFHIALFNDIMDVLRSGKSRLFFVLGTGHGELQLLVCLGSTLCVCIYNA